MSSKDQKFLVYALSCFQLHLWKLPFLWSTKKLLLTWTACLTSSLTSASCSCAVSRWMVPTSEPNTWPTRTCSSFILIFILALLCAPDYFPVGTRWCKSALRGASGLFCFSPAPRQRSFRDSHGGLRPRISPALSRPGDEKRKRQRKTFRNLLLHFSFSWRHHAVLRNRVGYSPFNELLFSPEPFVRC